MSSISINRKIEEDAEKEQVVDIRTSYTSDPEVDSLRKLWSMRNIPDIKSNRVSEAYTAFCQQEYDSWKKLEDAPMPTDFAHACSRSIGTNTSRFKSKLNALQDLNVQIFDRYLLGDYAWIKEHYGENMLKEMQQYKENPKGIYIDLITYNSVFHITNYRG